MFGAVDVWKDLLLLDGSMFADELLSFYQPVVPLQETFVLILSR